MAQNNDFLYIKMLFWTTHFSILDSTFWLESTLKIDPGVDSKYAAQL